MKQIRWINTETTYQWEDDKYVQVSNEGYWYSGPMALAHNAASLEEKKYRFWASDAVTPLANINASPTLSVDTTYVLQIELENNGDINEDSVTYEFQYNLNAAGWNNITGASSVIKTANPTGITDGNPTVVGDNLGSLNTFQAGEEVEDGVSSALALGTGNYTDFRFGFTVVADDVVNSDTIQFRCTFNSYTVLDSYGLTISSTVTEAVSGRMMGRLAGLGGLAGTGGLAGQGGGLAG